MNKLTKKSLEFFYSSKSRKVRKIKEFLDRKGIKIEDLMAEVTVEPTKVLRAMMKKIEDKNFNITKADLNDYLKNFRNATSTDSQGNTKGLTVSTLQNYFTTFKDGSTITKGSIPQMMFGCGTCPKLKREECKYGKNGHPKGGCPERYQFFAYYCKNAKGATIPLMIEHLGELKVMAQDRKEQLAKQGMPFDKDFLILQKIIIELEDKLHKAQHGTKMKVSKDITVKDVRKAFYDSGSEKISQEAIIDAEFEELKKEEDDGNEKS